MLLGLLQDAAEQTLVNPMLALTEFPVATGLTPIVKLFPLYLSVKMVCA